MVFMDSGRNTRVYICSKLLSHPSKIVRGQPAAEGKAKMAGMGASPGLKITANMATGVMLIRLHRPEAANALDQPQMMGIRRTLASAASDPSVKVVVLTSSSDGGHFSSGLDFSATPGEILAEETKTLVDAIVDFPKILVAFVNGSAVGTAVTLLALFDLVYADESATFSAPFSALGLTPDACSTITFPR